MRAKLYLLLFPLAAPLGACGGGGGDDGPGCSARTEIVITADGLSPASVEVAGGECIVFVNQDTVAHQPASNAHPTHTLCPQLNGDAVAANGGRRTNRMNRQGTCGFHDHATEDTQAKWRGTVVVTSDAAGGGGAYEDPGY